MNTDERATRLAELLKTEFGIGNMDELNKAIRKLGVVDISIFCAKKEVETA